MNRFAPFRRLRRQRLKPSGCRNAKPTKGAGIGFALFAIIYGLAAVAPIHAQDDSTILYPGTYQAEDANLILPKSARIIGVDNAQDVDAIDTDAATFTARGTEIRLRWQTEGELIVEVNDEIILFDSKLKFPDPFYGRKYSQVLQSQLHWIVASLDLQFSAIAETDVQLNHGWYEAVISRSTSAETRTFKIWSLNHGRERGKFQIDSITVLDRTFENVFPYIAAVGITLGMTLFVVISALRERWRR